VKAQSIHILLIASIAGPFALSCSSEAQLQGPRGAALNPPPVITNQPQAMTAPVGAVASFSVAATGDGALTYQWQKDGADLPGRTSATLALAAIQAGDAGAYRCIVTSTSGGATASVSSAAARLTVNQPPVITTQPQSLALATGGSGSLSVTASGSGTLSYSWLKGGAPLAGSTLSVLPLSNVTGLTAGSYVCVVTNTLDGTTTATTSATATVLIDQPLAILSQPQALTTPVGAAATFSVVAVGAGALGYQWQKDGVDLSGRTSATLALAAVQADDAGAYACVVTSTSNGATTSMSSAPARLTVNQPPAITAQPQPLTIAAAGSGSLSITVTGSGALSYQWTKGGAPLPGATRSVLSLSNVTGLDAGSYACVVTNTLDGTTAAATSATATVSINQPPAMLSQPAGLTVVAGSGATFSVTASGSGVLGYQWQKGGSDLSGRTAPDLTLSAVQGSDAGSYRVRVTNTLGGTTTSTLSDTAALAVNVAPIFSTQPQGTVVSAGATATFSALATGNGSISYQWQRGGTSLAGQTASSLSIPNAQDADAASYRVVASNTLGGTVTSSTSNAASLTIDHAPVITALVASTTTAKVGDAIALTVTASDPDSQPLSYAWSAQPAGCGTFSASATASTTLTAVSQGTCLATVTVTAAGRSASRSVAITVLGSGSTAPPAMPRVAYTYAVMSANGSTSGSATISGLGQAVVIWSLAGDTGPGDGNVQDGYDERLSDPSMGGTIGNASRNVPVDYVIEASANGGASWTPVVTMTGNTYIVRAHLVDLTGFNRVRMRLTSAPLRGAGGLGTDFAVHDARSGHADWWLFLGDSITTNVFNVHDSTKYGANIHARQPARWPVAHEGGISQGRIADFLWTGWRGSDGRPLLARWLDDFPGQYVSLGIGTNDINGGLDTINTMDANFRTLVNLVVAAGKTPVLPTLRWNSVGGANMPTWHARLTAILAANPGAVRGPDLYTRSLAQGSAGLLDGVHANAAGVALSQEDWALWAIANVY
jgi:lysophospholipase L1-like esterase